MTEIADRIAAAGTKLAFATIPDPTPKAARLSPFDQVLHEMASTRLKKGQDYGTATDTFANVRATEDFGVPAYIGAAMKCSDKLKRIQAFYINGRLENESIEDAFLDLAVYAAIGLCLYREGK